MQPDIEPKIEFSYGTVILTFAEHPEPFIASQAAEHYLRQRGFSVGRRQDPDPRGVLFGDVVVQKWRNLCPLERAGLHGLMTGNGRHGPIVVTIRSDAPYEVRVAVRSPPLPGQTTRLAKAFGDLIDAFAVLAIGFCLILLLAVFGPSPRVLESRLPQVSKTGIRAEVRHLPVETAEVRP